MSLDPKDVVRDESTPAEGENPSRRAVLKAAWGVPAVVMLGHLEYNKYGTGAVSPVGTVDCVGEEEDDEDDECEEEG